MTGWVTALSALSPLVAIALIYGWTKRIDNKAAKEEEDARIKLIEVLANQFVQPITRGLDANTEAVKKQAEAVAKSVEHNERIISNHVSHTEAVFQEVIEEMRRMNNRHRAND